MWRTLLFWEIIRKNPKKPFESVAQHFHSLHFGEILHQKEMLTGTTSQ
jgi:hypothetical protein